ncbi:MAG: hypothetical protein AAF431_06990 [Pseudomonadota bacterium]
MKVRLKDIAVDDLDRQSAILLNNFIKTAKMQEGVDIDLDDEHLVHRVFNMGKNTENTSLRMVFLSFRRTLRRCMKERSKQDSERMLLN